MPNIYVKKDLYDKLVERGKKPRQFINKLVRKYLYDENGKGEKSERPG